MGCAMPQEEQQQQKLSDNHHQRQQELNSRAQKAAANTMAPSATDANHNTKLAVEVQQQQQQQQRGDSNATTMSGNLKGTHSALVKLLESAPISQVRPVVLKQKLNAYNGNRTDQNHYRKGDLGTSKCPWKKSRICAEWVLKNQQETVEQQQAAAAALVSKTSAPRSPSPHHHHETDSMPKGEFLPPPSAATAQQHPEDVEMTDVEGLVCTCHELQATAESEVQEDGEEEEASLARRNSSDSTDDELAKCDCGHCSKQTVSDLPGGGAAAMVLSQHRTSSISDSGCEDSDCAENKITDLCNRFNENLSKDDVSHNTLSIFAPPPHSINC